MQSHSVMFVTSELNPLAKVGGLADVSGALPKALHKLGVDITVILPLYNVIDRLRYNISNGKEVFTVQFGNVRESVRVFRTTIPNSAVPIVLLDNPRFIGNGGVYGSPTAMAGTFSEIQRFVFFSFAATAYLQRHHPLPDVVHCQDWHTSLIPSILQRAGVSSKTILTLHTVGNQGAWNEKELRDFVGTDTDLSDDNDSDQTVRLLAHGIKTADWVTTVSPTYAREILTPEYGEGVHMFLQQREDHIVGILNGIDTEIFSPATDTNIIERYTARTVSNKATNKHALQREVGLPDSEAPLFSIVSRLTADQKGIDLVVDALSQIDPASAQFVILGTGETSLEARLKKLDQTHANISSQLRFDAGLAQRIYAGSDGFLMPSRYEPCGLGQLIAMRYGTLPVVRDTGGLHDTVIPHTESNGRGFVFQEPTSEALTAILRTAIQLYTQQPDRWNELVQHAMAADVSWDTSAKTYIQLYDRVVL